MFRICYAVYFDPKGLSPLLACHLVVLDKNLAIGPICILETVRHIISKAGLSVTHHDVLEATGSLPLCAGETAIPTIESCLEDDTSDCILMMDASNALNSLNWQTTMHNVLHLCPALAKMIINCYRQATDLMMSGSVLLSEEGTTQGDPLAMPFYTQAKVPLIRELSEKRSARQSWFEDDFSAVGRIIEV